MEKHKEYYRRRLPHIQPQNAAFFITFRLANSLPINAVLELIMEQQNMENRIIKANNIQLKRKLLEEKQRKYFGHFDEYLERIKKNPKWLVKAEIAEMVGDSIKFYDGKTYTIIAFCIMPNHVHLIIENCKMQLFKVMQKIKSYTAIKANRILNCNGQFWHHESYDRVIRDRSEYDNFIWYVMQNPVKAGLCNNWKNWRWSYLKTEYYNVME
ncbi:MAG: transposase [Bacteroidetes bacterium]|nr:transposase [Bacteroidota bacterium]